MKKDTEEKQMTKKQADLRAISNPLRRYADYIDTEQMALIDFSQNIEFDDCRAHEKGQSKHISFTIFTPRGK